MTILKLILKISCTLKSLLNIFILYLSQICQKGKFMETNLIIEGFKFMALGMGTVFLFLIILIFMMNVMSIVIQKFFPEPKQVASGSENKQQDNKKIIAAITAAITHHKQG